MMDDETTTASGSPAGEPVINVIEPDPPPVAGPPDSAAGADRFDPTANGMLAARRLREFEAQRARLRDQADRLNRNHPETAGPAPQPGTTERGAADTPAMRWAPLGDPPEKVRKRYLRAGNQYFLKDAPYQLAFEDIGPYLVTAHNHPDVVESMVAMAQAKSWGRIRVSGHEAFRREVWVQATLLGIEVGGYEPRPADLARVAEGRRERMTNRIDVMETGRGDAQADPGARPTKAAAPQPAAARRVSEPATPTPIPAAGANRPAPRTAPARGAPAARERAEPGEAADPQRHTGVLIEHGGAPYQHNPARSDSYYVVYRDARDVDHVVWGVDLERALAESGAQPGQQVMLENLGRKLVTVVVPVFGEAGAKVGEEEKDVYRNTWQADVVGQQRVASRPAETRPATDVERRSDTRAPGEATQQARRDDDVMDRAMQLAVLSEAMRRQGFGERSIARVQAHATQMLDAFQADGTPVPRPRVFDPDAPSTRRRRGRAAPEQTPAREVERAVAEPSSPSPPSL